ncbi:polysaccharide lyase 8 family protein [Arthrobacter sp. NPDC080073]|uniref:polysaccharide lyase 8 family protein n=1 Tax=Arthrobacter sp. NPDC080073 TaxID=3155919 RepID=UPI003427A061
MKTPPALAATPFTRRSLLRGTGAVAVAAALGSVFASSATAMSASDLEPLRQRWVDQLTGRTAIATGDPRFNAVITRMDSAVASVRRLLVPGPGTRTRIFSDADLAQDAQIVTTYSRIETLAIAWATPGTAVQADPVVLQEITEGLTDGNRLVYNTAQPEFGNWWSWEIGTPKALGDTLAIVKDHLDPALLDACCRAIDHFIPDPTLQYPDSRGKVLSTGANRVDICQGIMVRSIVGSDMPRLQAAISALSPTWQYVASGDGFHADGSFIQHNTVPYTGTYGLGLLSGLAKLFSLLAASTSAAADPGRSRLFDSVDRSFAPFIHDGLMMDSVRGRAISRSSERSFDDGASAIEAILWLARGVDQPTAAAWRSMCLGWIKRNGVTDIYATSSIPRLALLVQLEASTSATAPEPLGHRYFPAMDRSTYRGPGWAVALGLCSRRIAWYECGNGENDTGYNTGSGLTYLYAADALHWDDHYWPTADLTALPGTTVDKTPLPPKAGGEWGSSTPKNEYTGGTTLDSYGLVAQHLIGPGGTGLKARKSWFFTQEFVLALGADITTASGARVETTIEHRNLGQSGGRAITVDGALLGTSDGASAQGVRWAHVEGVGGYLFLGEAPVRVSRQRRSGTWRAINTGGPTTSYSREYATIAIDHGLRPATGSPGTYFYALLPGATPAETERSSLDGLRIEPLRNDALAQGIRTGKLTAAAFWQAATVGLITASGPALVLAWQSNGIVKLAVSEPTQTAVELVLRVAGTKATRARSAGEVKLTVIPDGVELRVSTAGLAGTTLAVDLLP